MKDFKGKTAVVTGAASGLGKAMATDLARRGMNIVAADIEEPALQSAAEEFKALGVECLPVVCNVAEQEQVESLADQAFDKFGGVHVVCNNAGVAGGGPLEKASLKDWKWIIDVDLWGVVYGVQAFVPRMVEQNQGGHIVNTASMAGLIASKGMGIYNTAKYAVVGLSETLQKDLRDYNIGVSVLCPMGVHTRIGDSERNRPTELKKDAPPREGVDLVGNYLTPEHASKLVMAAIEGEQLYIVTHPESEEFLIRRFERIKKAYRFFENMA